MLRVWGRRSAFNVQKVMWAIGELGLAHEHIDAGGAFGGLNTPEFLSMNPHGRIPVIVDGGTTVWESHSILRYLAARYGSESLWPTDPAERSKADRWMDWTLATLQVDFMNLFWGFYRTPEHLRNAQLIRTSMERCAEHYRLLDRILSKREFLAGDRFTLADVPAATTLYRYFELEIGRPDAPHVSAWYGRLSARPAYREHVMIPFEELRGRLDF
jgi:glutathione S-transferase